MTICTLPAIVMSQFETRVKNNSLCLYEWSYDSYGYYTMREHKIIEERVAKLNKFGYN